MALNIGGTGLAKPYTKYNAKADKWFVRGADGQDAEIQRPTFVIDLENIATGWLLFREGQAPERLMDPSLEQPAPSPGEGFKRGFVVATYSPKFFGGVAEFASASIHLANAIKDIYAQYEAEKANHRGQLPVIACTGSEAMKDRYSLMPSGSLASWASDLHGMDSHSIPTRRGSSISATTDQMGLTIQRRMVPRSPSLASPTFGVSHGWIRMWCDK